MMLLSMLLSQHQPILSVLSQHPVEKLPASQWSQGQVTAAKAFIARLNTTIHAPLIFAVAAAKKPARTGQVQAFARFQNGFVYGYCHLSARLTTVLMQQSQAAAKPSDEEEHDHTCRTLNQIAPADCSLQVI